MSDDGLIATPSRHDAKTTMDRLDAAVNAAGMTVFARIDHAAGAAAAGMALRPTAVLIFGNARAGTPLMEARQSIGIDLPLKVLVWEDADGKTWLTHNDPHYLAARHALGSASAGIVETMSAALEKLTRAAGG